MLGNSWRNFHRNSHEKFREIIGGFNRGIPWGISRESSGGISREITVEISSGISREVPEEKRTFHGTSWRIYRKIPVGRYWEIPGGIYSEIFEGMARKIPGRVSKEIRGEISRKSSRRISREIAGEISRKKKPWRSFQRNL